jgi:hypothetical protein
MAAGEHDRYSGCMSKGRRKQRRSGPVSRPAAADGQALLAEIDARLDEIAGSDPAAAGPIWGAAHKLLLKAKADPGELARLIATRDVEGLRRLVATLHGDRPPEEPAGEEAPTPGAPAAGPNIPAETLKKAMHAFRRRLKLVRLDHESKLGVGPMTSGRKAEIDAIMPPREFPEEVWQALVAEGRLRPAGKGFFMLAETAADG